MSELDNFTICICGGGNGAHVLAGLSASRPGVTVHVLSLYADEAERWNKLLNEKPLSVTFQEGRHSQPEMKSKPHCVTNVPADALANAQLIVLTVPAFAHAQYLQAMQPHLQKNASIVGLPGQPGFEFEARYYLKERLHDVALLTYATLPWACRISEFGRQVHVIGTKESIEGAIQVDDALKDAADIGRKRLQYVLGAAPVLLTTGHPLLFSITSPNSMVHTSIMFGQWENYNGETYDEAPLFYQGLSQPSADLMSKLSDECLLIAKKIQELKPSVDLSKAKHMLNWYLDTYEKEIEDKTNLYTCIRTNRAYVGLTHPMKTAKDGKLEPNFEARYLAEDVPCGLLVAKGVAEVAGLDTPTIDKVLEWCQSRLGKEYLVNGKVCGKDVKESRAPQKYGYTKLDDFI